MKNNLKLPLKILLLAFPFIAMTVIYGRLDILKNKYDLGKFDSVPENIDLANLGSSHAYIAFDYSTNVFKEMKCFNFALFQQTLDFDHAILKQYINKFKKNGILIICLSPFETNGIPDYEFDLNSKLRYYQFLKPQYIEFFSIKEMLYSHCLSIFSSPHPIYELKEAVKAWYEKTIRREHYQALTSDENFESEISSNTYAEVSEEEKILQAENLVKHWTKTIPPSPKGKEFNLHYIDSIIDLCRNKNLKTVVVTPPISKEVFLELNKNCTYYSLSVFYEELEKKYPETLFLNYVDLYFEKAHLLGDNNHLNKKGAREFSKTLYLDMKESGFFQ